MMRAPLRTTTGLQDFKIPGFGLPIGAIFVLSEAQVDGVQTDQHAFSVGASDGSNHWVAASFSDHNPTTSNTAVRSAQDEVFMILDTGSGVVDAEGNFDSFIPDGVRLNVTVVGNPSGRLLTVYLIGGDGVSFKVDAINGPAASSAATYTTGFKSHAIFLFRNGQFDDNVSSAGVFRFGFAGLNGSTITQCCYSQLTVDGSANQDVRAIVSTDKIHAVEGDAVAKQLVVTAITSTTFDLTAGTTDQTAGVFGYFSIGLGSTGQAWAGIKDTPTKTGKHTFTGADFLPTFGMMMPNMVTSVDSDKTNAEAGAYGLCGFYVDAEFSNSWADEDASALMDNQSVSDDQAINLDQDDGSDGFEATFDSFSGHSVKLDFSIVDSTVRKWPLLLLKK